MRVVTLFLLILAVCLVASPAFAEEAAAASAGIKGGLIAIGAGIGMGLAALGVGLGQGQATAAAMESTALPAPRSATVSPSRITFSIRRSTPRVLSWSPVPKAMAGSITMRSRSSN